MSKLWERDEIWFSDLSAAAQRELVRLAMQNHLRRDPGTVTEMTPFSGPSLYSLLDEVTFDFQGAQLSEVAIDQVTIASAFWGQSRTSGTDEYVAHDLGDELWYITHLDANDDSEFVAVVPKSAASEVYRALQEGWLDEIAFGDISYPTEFSAIDADEPWFIRKMTRRVLEGDNPLWLHLSEEHQPPDKGFGGEEAVVAVFRAAVTVGSGTANESDVPGLAVWQETSPAFAAWLEQNPLRWRDTGEPIDLRTAQALRLVCLYLA